MKSTLFDALPRVVPRRAKDFAKHILRPLSMVRTRVRMAIGVEPLSVSWGYNWGRPTILRFYLDQFLQEFSGDIRGHCLEFQEDSYTSRFGGGRVTKLDIIHHDTSNPNATIVADLTRPNQIPSDVFDCVICTHVLHVIFEVGKVVAELHRILKPGGVLLVGVPHVSMYSPRGNEFWRFTPLGLNTLLAQAFDSEQVLVRGYGNSLAAAASMKGMAAQDLTKAELDFQDERFAVEVCARAAKKS